MRRRDFLHCGLAAAATLVGSRRASSFREARLLFFDAATIAERSEVALVPPPLEKLGLLLEGDSPGDSAGVSAAMGCGILHLDDGRLRLYYSGYSKGEPQRGTCVAESGDGLHWTKPRLGQVHIDGSDSNRLGIGSLPDGSHVQQPSVVRLPDGRWRMYGWLGRSRPRILRYIAAESADGLHWKAVNVDQPCLRHPLELSPLGSWSWLDGPESRKRWQETPGPESAPFLELKRLLSNDAVHTYADPSGGFEMFSVWALPNRPDSGRYVAYDNAKVMLRVIHRRTSEDGLRWSDPELLLVPDEQDAWDQQFYYLAQHRLPDQRVGFLGRYRVVDQDMDIEFVYSRDGRKWHRPLRGAWLPRGPAGSLDSTRVYMPTHLIDRGDHWLGLYSAVDTKHNEPSERSKRTVHGVKIPRHRFAGLNSQSTLSARVRTVPFILSAPRLLLDAAVAGSLRAELCNSFGRPLEGLTFADSLPVTGDSQRHELRWKTSTAADYQYDAVSLRMEWTRGVVYGVWAS